MTNRRRQRRSATQVIGCRLDLSFVICHLSFYSPVAQLAPPFAPSFWILGTVGTIQGQPNVASNRKRFGLSIWRYVSRVVSNKAGSALFLPARATFLSRWKTEF